MNRKRARKIKNASTVIVGALGTLGLANWIVGLTLSTRLTPGWTSMKPITGVSFIVAAFALWAISKPRWGQPVALGAYALRSIAGGIIAIDDNAGVVRVHAVAADLISHDAKELVKRSIHDTLAIKEFAEPKQFDDCELCNSNGNLRH